MIVSEWARDDVAEEDEALTGDNGEEDLYQADEMVRDPTRAFVNRNNCCYRLASRLLWGSPRVRAGPDVFVRW